MNEQGVKTKAWYCSDEFNKGSLDTEFGVEVKWDVPLLEGYEYKFFKNYSWKPSQANGFFGLINLGMIRQVFREPKSVIVVHGWHYCTHLLILMLGKIKGHTVCIRNDMPQKQEVLKKGWKQVIKKIGLKYFLFPRINYFLYVGTQNRLLYQNYKLPLKRLISCPYSVDNNRFKADSQKLKASIPAIKRKIGIPANDRVILFTAKYIEKKRPLDLLQAFMQLNAPDCWLILVGEGELRKDMEKFINEKKIKRVILTGFINQSGISEYYAIADLFVLCSSVGENWGLSANEAMNFNLPLILSDLTGCSDDLVKDGINGYVFKTRNVDELTLKLKQVLIENKLTYKVSSESLVDKYSYAEVVNNIKSIL